MELRVKMKDSGSVCTCLPGFININLDGRFLVKYGGVEMMAEMCNFDIYIKPKEEWLDLVYAHTEGFLDPEQLRNWP